MNKTDTIKIKSKEMNHRMTQEELVIHMAERSKGRQPHKSIKNYSRKPKYQNRGSY